MPQTECDRCGTDKPVGGLEIVRGNPLAHRPDQLWCAVCRSMITATMPGAQHMSVDMAILVNTIRKDIADLRQIVARVLGSIPGAPCQ